MCEDENVEREERKVREEGATSRNILTLRELTKVYDQCSLRGNARVAVNRLNLSMKPSEVHTGRRRGRGRQQWSSPTGYIHTAPHMITLSHLIHCHRASVPCCIV